MSTLIPHLRRSFGLAATALAFLAGPSIAASDALAADVGYGEPAASSFPDVPPAVAPIRNWTLIVGGGASYEPEYEGGEDFEIDPVPVFLFTYGDWLQIDPTGAELTVLTAGDVSFSALVSYETGRDADDADRLAGLGDIDFAPTIGGKATYEWGPVDFYASIEQTIGGSESLIGTSGVSLTAPVTERLILGASAEATIADDNHMQAYFGVDAIQAAASGLPVYEAEAGLKRVDVAVSATYLVTENWLVRGEVGAGYLTGDAGDSPIVEEELQPSATLFLGYKF